jgi:EAL domain
MAAPAARVRLGRGVHPVAESIRVIGDLGHWVLRTACARVSRWQDLTLAVNVSPLQLGPAAAGPGAGRPGRRRPEPGPAHPGDHRDPFGSDNPQVLACVQELAVDGVKLSVDDLGTGHSSLSRLHSFPIREPKIDKSFVIGLATGESHAGFVAGVIAWRMASTSRWWPREWRAATSTPCSRTSGVNASRATTWAAPSRRTTSRLC